MNIGNDLIKAYMGVHEDELQHLHKVKFENSPEVQDFDQWAEPIVKNMINQASPKDRLDTYLQWNGILGWTNRIWELSQGEL